MPNLPDIPGKSLIGGTTKRARVVAAAGAGAALAVGGVVAKRVLGHQPAKPEAAKAEPKAAPKAKVAPKPDSDKAKPPKPKADKAKPPKPKAAKAKPPKPKAAPKPKSAAGKSKVAAEPGNRSHDKGPHQALNNPVGEPDETEHPEGGRPPRRENLDQ